MDSFLRWWRGEEDIVYAGVDDYRRQQAQREAEVQSALQRARGELQQQVQRKDHDAIDHR